MRDVPDGVPRERLHSACPSQGGRVKKSVFCRGGPKHEQILPADVEDGTYLIFNRSTTPWAYYRATDEQMFDEQLGPIAIADYVGEHPQ